MSKKHGFHNTGIDQSFIISQTDIVFVLTAALLHIYLVPGTEFKGWHVHPNFWTRGHNIFWPPIFCDKK